MREIAARLGGLALLAVLLGSCGESEPPPPTRVCVIWDSVDALQLHPCGAKHDTTPVLSALAREGRVDARFNPGTTSSTAQAAAWLSASELVSIRELGRDRIDPTWTSTADGRPGREGWIALGSASQAHFDYAGLGLGHQAWHAPELEQIGRPRPAEAVFEAIREELATALEKEAAVELFLHFGDLRGRGWVDRAEPSRWLETFLAPWRGEGGAIDEAFALPEKDGERLRALKNALLRRRGDERRIALLEALYAAELSRLDAVLGQVFDELRRAGRFETAKIEVVGGPSVTPEVAASRDGPGPRVHVPLVSSDRAVGSDGWSDRERELHELVEPGAEWESSTVVRTGRSGRVFLLSDPAGEVRWFRTFAQRVSVFFRGEEGDSLSLTATCPEVELDLLPPGAELAALEGEETPQRPPNATTRRFELPASQTLGIVPDKRGVDLLLRFAREGLGESDLSIAGRPFLESDLPVLFARNGPPWPEGVAGPALELRPLPGRRSEIVVPGPEGAQVELWIETFPAGRATADDFAGAGIEVAPHPRRVGAFRVSGTAPLRIGLPRRSPNERFGLALFLDGERIASSRMRLGDRCYRTPGELEIGLGAGVWIDPRYRGAPGAESPGTIALELHDRLPPPEQYTPPTPEERALLERLDDDE